MRPELERAAKAGRGPAASPPAPAARSGALAEALARARRLPGYAEAFADIPPGLDPVESLRRLPVLERAAIQERPEAFQDPTVPSVLLSSSGSTGTPLALRLERSARRRRRRQFARFFLRSGWRPWHSSLSFKVVADPSARLGSALLDRTALRRRTTIDVLEPAHRQYELLRAADPRILHGLPSIFEELAVRAQFDRWRPSRLRRIFTASEALAPEVRVLLEDTLGAPVFETYAASEAFVGWQCERRDGFHILESNVVVEVLDEHGAPADPGSVGRVTITALDNRATALIRYAIGDMAVAPSGAVCPCGRPGPLLPRVLGRQVPMLSIAGRTVSPWGVVARMHELAFLRQFQLAQPAPDELIVRIRVRDGQALDRPAVQRLVVEELGPIVRTEVEEVEAMPRLPSGKAAPVVVATDALDAPVPGA